MAIAGDAYHRAHLLDVRAAAVAGPQVLADPLALGDR
jgi:hypothetical protein